eukprot:m.145483 g.145483  ORF g.145483 m.145483 type:complete len:779 (-) comp16065_c1_seq1:229-2565(-)
MSALLAEVLDACVVCFADHQPLSKRTCCSKPVCVSCLSAWATTAERAHKPLTCPHCSAELTASLPIRKDEYITQTHEQILALAELIDSDFADNPNKCHICSGKAVSVALLEGAEWVAPICVNCTQNNQEQIVPLADVQDRLQQRIDARLAYLNSLLKSDTISGALLDAEQVKETFSVAVRKQLTMFETAMEQRQATITRRLEEAETQLKEFVRDSKANAQAMRREIQEELDSIDIRDSEAAKRALETTRDSFRARFDQEDEVLHQMVNQAKKAFSSAKVKNATPILPDLVLGPERISFFKVMGQYLATAQTPVVWLAHPSLDVLDNISGATTSSSTTSSSSTSSSSTSSWQRQQHPLFIRGVTSQLPRAVRTPQVARPLEPSANASDLAALRPVPVVRAKAAILKKKKPGGEGVGPARTSTKKEDEEEEEEEEEAEEDDIKQDVHDMPRDRSLLLEKDALNMVYEEDGNLGRATTPWDSAFDPDGAYTFSAVPVSKRPKAEQTALFSTRQQHWKDEPLDDGVVAPPLPQANRPASQGPRSAWPAPVPAAMANLSVRVSSSSAAGERRPSDPAYVASPMDGTTSATTTSSSMATETSASSLWSQGVRQPSSAAPSLALALAEHEPLSRNASNEATVTAKRKRRQSIYLTHAYDELPLTREGKPSVTESMLHFYVKDKSESEEEEVLKTLFPGVDMDFWRRHRTPPPPKGKVHRKYTQAAISEALQHSKPRMFIFDPNTSSVIATTENPLEDGKHEFLWKKPHLREATAEQVRKHFQKPS